MVAVNSKPAETVTARLMREIAESGALSLNEVGRMFKDSEKPEGYGYNSLFRWVVHGAKTFDGRRVRLEAIRLGMRWQTSRAAVERFIAARSNFPESDEEARSPAERKRASDHAARELEAMGV